MGTIFGRTDTKQHAGIGVGGCKPSQPGSLTPAVSFTPCPDYNNDVCQATSSRGVLRRAANFLLAMGGTVATALTKGVTARKVTMRMLPAYEDAHSRQGRALLHR